MLTIARHAITAAVRGESYAIGDAEGLLFAKRACFVTLRTCSGDLRGCIGTLDASQALSAVIEEMAVAAATRDPRFTPVTEREVEELSISITVLGSAGTITTPEEIDIGRDGLIVSQGGQRGLLLPQVAIEQGWDRVTFLEQTCLKAGLPKNAWRSPETKIETFSGEVISQ